MWLLFGGLSGKVRPSESRRRSFFLSGRESVLRPRLPRKGTCGFFYGERCRPPDHRPSFTPRGQDAGKWMEPRGKTPCTLHSRNPFPVHPPAKHILSTTEGASGRPAAHRLPLRGGRGKRNANSNCFCFSDFRRKVRQSAAPAAIASHRLPGLSGAFHSPPPRARLKQRKSSVLGCVLRTFLLKSPAARSPRLRRAVPFVCDFRTPPPAGLRAEPRNHKTTGPAISAIESAVHSREKDASRQLAPPLAG